MAREFPRSRRVEQQLLRTLNELLMFEVKDPRARGVSISAVEVAPDLAVARVWFSLLDPDADPAPAAEALSSAAGFLRSRLSRELTLRRSPELRFQWDDSSLRGSSLSRLIDEARSRDRDGDPD